MVLRKARNWALIILGVLALGAFLLQWEANYAETSPVQAKDSKGSQNRSQRVSPGQEPDVIAQQRGVDSRKAKSPESDVNVPADPSRPQEDEQGWDCYSMGNGVCGVNPAPKYSYEDGSATYAKPKNHRAVITDDGVNQRVSPGGSVSGTLDKGFSFNAVCTSGGWVQGSQGNYVSSDYVKVGSLPRC